MFAEYIDGAVEGATFDKLETGEFYGQIPLCQGVWASGETLEGCRKELIEVLEDWLLLKLRDGDEIPVVGGVDLNLERV